MQKLLDKVRRVLRPNDAKHHKDGFEMPDPTAIEVPLKLLNRHADAQAYIRAYVQSEVKLAQLNAEHETAEDAFDLDVDDPNDTDIRTAAEMEADDLAQMAQDSYDLRRVKAMVDRDRRFKEMRRGAPAPKGSEAPVADVNVKDVVKDDSKLAPTNPTPSS